jgi:protoporphyrinogen oxidase
MIRREFIRLSTLAILPLIASCRADHKAHYDILVSSDMPIGHLSFSAGRFPLMRTISHETLIVGGGISGLAAASALRDHDFVLCELSNEPGGTSGSIVIDGNRFAQGAHYDLAYPDYFGEEVLSFLDHLGIIQFNSFNSLWEFRDKQFLINPAHESRCLSRGKYRNDVIPETPERGQFQAILEPFRKVMRMPTTIIAPQYHYLNDLTFSGFLDGKFSMNREFKNSLDYNMMDDYGGTTDDVSALAGIHYYQCRPYFYQPVELFSPPQGNYYFIEKMLSLLPSEKILTGHLVRKITKTNDGFDAEIIDIRNSGTLLLKAKKVVYAGTKHALKYIFPEQSGLFSGINYAPWLVINMVMDKPGGEEPFWQNEILGENPSLLGFVNSDAQYHQLKNKHLLTAYYCFKPSQRAILGNIEHNKNRIARQTIRYVSEYFGFDVSARVQKIFMKVLGHAMPVPVPHFLFNDKNSKRSYNNLVYAGVDNSRLPLLFEALDSGLVAARLIKE